MRRHCLLYYITDRTQFPGDESARRRALLEKIAEAVQAGVDYIQLREKDPSTRELVELAEESVRLVGKLTTENQELRTRLLVNSRTDVALAAGADGVHLRSDDIPPSTVRSIWSKVLVRNSQREPLSPFIAVSCHTSEEVLCAEKEGADFAVFAPVFEKRDRPNAPPIGLPPLRDACQATIPVLALGGITLQNTKACLDAGAAGIAAIRLFQENRIEEVVRTLRGL